MVVEDEGIPLKHLQVMLRKANADLIGFARDARNAIDLALVARPELILLDHNLAGGGSGLDVAAEIKRVYNPCIVMLTAFGAAVAEHAAVHSIDAVVAKPTTFDELLPAILAAIREHNAAGAETAGCA